MRGLSSVLGMKSAITRQKQNFSTMPKPDLTLLFSGDVTDWDRYLARHFEDAIVQHEQIEDILFPVPSCKAAFFSDSRVVLVILSPQFLAFLENHPEDCYQLSKLLKPGKTLAMLCGVKPDDVKYFHKAALGSYNDWRHLVISTDKDVTMVRNVIEAIQEMLARSKENERINKPRFKLIPRKVQEGNGKVYVMLTKPLDINVKIRVCLGVNGMKEVPVKKRNPYTLMFVIPDDCMNLLNLLNIHIWCGEDLLGVSQVKCESKMGELYSLLTTVHSPYEFLCNTLGLATLHDVDEYLTSSFQKNMPKSGFELLQVDCSYHGEKTTEELPTLLHFASRYGLCQLVKELLLCPGAEIAYLLKNVRNLTPAQLANHAGHNDVAAIIDEYQVSLHTKTKEHSLSFAVDSQVDSKEKFEPEKPSSPSDYYDIPAYPVPVPSPTQVDETLRDKECEYLKMHSLQKENIEPHQSKFVGMQDKRDFLNDILSESNKSLSKDNSQLEKSKLALLESQEKLIEIMEAYKKGASLTEVERLHNEWKALYQVTDIEAKSTLEGLRNLYAKAQKAKLSKKHSTSFSELRQFLHSKLRRKDSIGSKSTLSRKSSKDMSSMEKLSAESDANRPISTLSVLSNTSSSSGSSFDRLSTASAGSDSGHHSDLSEDRCFKRKDKSDTKACPDNTPCWLANSSSPKNVGPFSGKPPAPPPRPSKPISRYATVENSKELPEYAISRKSATLPNHSDRRSVDYIQPDSNNYNEGCQKESLSKKDLSFLEDPNANYDCPPPPRPNCPMNDKRPQQRQRTFSITSNHDPQLDYDLVPPPRPSCDLKQNDQRSRRRTLSTSSRDPKTDYDLVPPPLPLSAPPRKLELVECYDILSPRIRSSSVSSSYDFPKPPVIDHCAVRAAKLVRQEKIGATNKESNLPSVPSYDIKPELRKDAWYHNLCYKPGEEVRDHRDSIPEEMAPPPPVEALDSTDEHYKVVGYPIPVSKTLIQSS